MPRKYGIRDDNGKVTDLSEKDYQQKYLQLQEANRIATDKNNKFEITLSHILVYNEFKYRHI